MWRVRRRRSAGELLQKVDLRKKLVQNVPYLLIGLYATKLSQAWRLAAGNDASEKLLHYSAGLSEAFQSPLPSFAVHDLLFGAAVGLLLALVVLEKRRNRKKLPQRNRVWFSTLGNGTGHCPLYRPETREQLDSDPNGTADDE